MKTEWYFKQLDQQYVNEPVGEVVLRGSVPAWTCSCYWVNGESVPTCNYCGQARPQAASDLLTDDECDNPRCQDCNGPIDSQGECLDVQCREYSEDDLADRMLSEGQRLGFDRL